MQGNSRKTSTSTLLTVLKSLCGGGDGLVTKSCPTLVTPWTIACQVPLSLGFSRQEYWHGLPFPSPGDLSDPGIEQVSYISGRFFTNWDMEVGLSNIWVNIKDLAQLECKLNGPVKDKELKDYRFVSLCISLKRLKFIWKEWWTIESVWCL